MQRTRWTTGSPTVGPCVAAIGVFDGVHLGHQDLLADTVALARSEGVSAAVLTFEPDPHVILDPTSHPARIVDADTRAALIAASGVDSLVEVGFDEELAKLDATTFVQTVLQPALDPVGIIVGEDFRFGAGASGDVSLLTAHGAQEGFRVLARELTVREGSPVTATRIRDLVSAGAVSSASRLLGRPFSVSGPIVHGRGVGRTLDAPTANIAPTEGFLVPGDGVYAAVAMLDDADAHSAAVSIGVPPTYAPESPRTIEAHLIDFEGDLYGRSLRLDLIERLRDLVAFDDPRTLGAAIAQDIAAVRELLAG